MSQDHIDAVDLYPVSKDTSKKSLRRYALGIKQTLDGKIEPKRKEFKKRPIQKSITKIRPGRLFLKKISDYKLIIRELGKNYLYKLRDKNLSPERSRFCKDIYDNYGIIVISDPDITDHLSSLANNDQKGASWGKFVFLRKWDFYRFEELVRHEVEHALQTEEVGNVVKFWKDSIKDFIQKKKELSGLVPRASAYAAQNHNGERTTYPFQVFDDYLENRIKFLGKNFNDQDVRILIVKKHFERYIIELQNKINILSQSLDEPFVGPNSEINKADIRFKLGKLSEEMKKRKELFDSIDKHERYMNITYGLQDGYVYGETRPDDQIMFAIKEQHTWNVVIDMVYCHYEKKFTKQFAGELKGPDIKQKAVKIYNYFKPIIDPLVGDYYNHTSKKRLLKQKKVLFKCIDKCLVKEGISILDGSFDLSFMGKYFDIYLKRLISDIDDLSFTVGDTVLNHQEIKNLRVSV